ncbi:MAG: hypothetical protein V8T09_00525 [Oscillospiraceae bacterium]
MRASETVEPSAKARPAAENTSTKSVSAPSRSSSVARQRSSAAGKRNFMAMTANNSAAEITNWAIRRRAPGTGAAADFVRSGRGAGRDGALRGGALRRDGAMRLPA